MAQTPAPSPIEAAELLERVADLVATAGDETLSAWAVPAICAYLAGEDDLERLLGLRPTAGQSSVATQRRIRERDALICAAAMRWWPGSGASEQGRDLHDELVRYERTMAWRRRDREADTFPQQLAGTRRADVWKILKANDGDVLSPDRISRILKANRSV